MIFSFFDIDEISSIKINEKYSLILKSPFLNFWRAKRKFKCGNFYFKINKILPNSKCADSKINFSLETSLFYQNIKSSSIPKITNETIFSGDKFTLQLFTGDPYKLASGYCEIQEGKLTSFNLNYENNNTQNLNISLKYAKVKNYEIAGNRIINCSIIGVYSKNNIEKIQIWDINNGKFKYVKNDNILEFETDCSQNFYKEGNFEFLIGGQQLLRHLWPNYGTWMNYIDDDSIVNDTIIKKGTKIEVYMHCYSCSEKLFNNAVSLHTRAVFKTSSLESDTNIFADCYYTTNGEIPLILENHFNCFLINNEKIYNRYLILKQMVDCSGKMTFISPSLEDKKDNEKSLNLCS